MTAGTDYSFCTFIYSNFRGVKRPWSAAVLLDKDERLAKHLFGSLSKSEKLIGNNQPYSGRLKNDCLFRHGTEKGLPHALIELRQDCLLGELIVSIGLLSCRGFKTAEKDAACAERKFLGHILKIFLKIVMKTIQASASQVRLI